MALATDKCVFLHIPKTGGIWIKSALVFAGIPFEEIGQQHEHFPYLYDFKPKSFFDNRMLFTMVRHPIPWYQSRWAFRIKHGWQARHPLDWACASNDFHIFVEKVLQLAPDGWCNWLFKQYCEREGSAIDFIGRTEFLVDDFLKAMKLAGHDVNEERVRSLEVANSSTMDDLKSGYWAKYTPELYDRVSAVEANIINRFYLDFPIDPKNHCGPLPY